MTRMILGNQQSIKQQQYKYEEYAIDSGNFNELKYAWAAKSSIVFEKKKKYDEISHAV